MNTQSGEAFGQRRIVGSDHSAIAIASQVLAWEEDETAHVPDTARAASLVFGSNSLGGILNNRNSSRLRHVANRTHIGTRAKQVYRDDGSDPFVSIESPLYQLRIQVEGVGVDVHKHRDGAEPGDGARGGEECEWSGDHAIPAPDLHCH